jgi:hypothetical protein
MAGKALLLLPPSIKTENIISEPISAFDSANCFDCLGKSYYKHQATKADKTN